MQKVIAYKGNRYNILTVQNDCPCFRHERTPISLFYKTTDDLYQVKQEMSDEYFEYENEIRKALINIYSQKDNEKSFELVQSTIHVIICTL